MPSDVSGEIGQGQCGCILKVHLDAVNADRAAGENPGIKKVIALQSSLIAVVKLIADGVAGQAHGSLRDRNFGRLIMALDRLGRSMWCSRLPGSGSIGWRAQTRRRSDSEVSSAPRLVWHQFLELRRFRLPQHFHRVRERARA